MRLTPGLILWVYLHPREMDGRLRFEPVGNPIPDQREQLRRQYHTYGITDPRTVDRLYGEWSKRTAGAGSAGAGDGGSA